MLVLGLTGSIAMGKSAVAAMFRARGVPVFDADAEVHRLYAGELVSPIEVAFPGTTGAAGVDRGKLADALLKEPGGFKRLEALVHPRVRDAERLFLHERARNGAKVAVLEIPLLFETGADAVVDAVVVASASPEVQRGRLLLRPGMTEMRLEALLARQTPDAEKRRRADFVVDTNGTLEDSERQVDAILDAVLNRAAHAFARSWQ